MQPSAPTPAPICPSCGTPAEWQPYRPIRDEYGRSWQFGWVCGELVHWPPVLVEATATAGTTPEVSHAQQA